MDYLVVFVIVGRVIVGWVTLGRLVILGTAQVTDFAYVSGGSQNCRLIQ